MPQQTPINHDESQAFLDVGFAGPGSFVRLPWKARRVPPHIHNPELSPLLSLCSECACAGTAASNWPYIDPAKLPHVQSGDNEFSPRIDAGGRDQGICLKEFVVQISGPVNKWLEHRINSPSQSGRTAENIPF